MKESDWKESDWKEIKDGIEQDNAIHYQSKLLLENQVISLLKID
jgi:hypothetical protein